MRGFTTIELLIGAAIVAAISGIIHSIYEDSQCTKWEETSVYICNGTDNHMVCKPQKRCVEFKDE